MPETEGGFREICRDRGLCPRSRQISRNPPEVEVQFLLNLRADTSFPRRVVCLKSISSIRQFHKIRSFFIRNWYQISHHQNSIFKKSHLLSEIISKIFSISAKNDLISDYLVISERYEPNCSLLLIRSYVWNQMRIGQTFEFSQVESWWLFLEKFDFRHTSGYVQNSFDFTKSNE